MSYQLLSLLIPFIVILLAIFTKRIIPSLIVGLILGGIFLAKGNIINGFIYATEHLVESVANEESLYIVLFLYVFGAFGEIMKVSGGIKGFSQLADRYVKTEKGALLTIWVVTLVTFIDCCFHVISTGTIGKALIDKVKGSKKKLALIVNVTSCLLIILIPFGTTYIGYIVGVISSTFNKAGVDQSAYSVYIRSIPFNLYAIVMLVISIGILFFNLGFGKEMTSGVTKKQLEESEHHGHEAHEQCQFEEQAPPRPLNLLLPLGLLITSTFFFFWITGRDESNTFLGAIMNADFEKAILISGIVSVVLTSIFYSFQRIPMREIESHFLSGGAEMIPPIIVLILSWGLSSIIESLGFVDIVTRVIGTRIPEMLIPAIIFLVGCVTSYFMGSAWGTWALIMPIAVPLAISTDISLPLMVGAVLSGGSLGDNASPLGETAILSATISEIPLMEHIKSQLPYSLAAIAISTILFIVLAMI